MSFLKFWSNKSSSDKNKKSAKDTSPPAWPELTAEEQAEADKFPFSAGKRDKNLSMSRSGRYKYKAKQRGALMGQEDELYASHKAAAAAAGGTGGAGPSHNTRNTQNSTANRAGTNQGSLGRSSNQGSVGRAAGGGQCAVEESTKRYPGRSKMSSQPTAVWCHTGREPIKSQFKSPAEQTLSNLRIGWKFATAFPFLAI